MSPELQADFVAQWPDLSRRLQALLRRKNVAPTTRDDLVQETALRLLKMWDSVDRTRSPWPLTATIALNLLRDRAKALATTEVLAELPDAPVIMDVESAGIARVELDRVRRAMAELTDAQRTILLDEVGEAGVCEGTAASQKMLRMRARRKLRLILERVSGIAVLRSGRASEWFGALFGSRDAIAQGVACVTCALIGTAVVASNLAPTRVEAQTLDPRRTARATVAAEDRGWLDDLPKTLKSAAKRDGELVVRTATARSTRKANKSAKYSNDTLSPSQLPLPSGSGDTPVPMPPTPSLPTVDDPAPPSPSDGTGELPLPLGSDDSTPTFPVPGFFELR